MYSTSLPPQNINITIPLFPVLEHSSRVQNVNFANLFYFHPDKNSVKKKLVGRNIPARALDMLIQAVCRKYRVYPEDFEWTAAKGSPDPFGRVVDEDYLEERRVKKY